MRKNITIGELAIMISNGFEKLATKEQVNTIEKDVKEIKVKLNEVISRTDKLETRVDYVENILSLPTKKN